jgi:uncharacterized protein YecT (DUF1311 family)
MKRPNTAFLGYGLSILLAFQIAPAAGANCKVNPDRWLDERCLQQAVAETSADIEKTRNELVAGADETRRPLLVQAHLAWLAYRREQCKLEFDMTRVMHGRYSEHGTMAPMLERKCQLRLNDARLLEMRVAAKRS